MAGIKYLDPDSTPVIKEFLERAGVILPATRPRYIEVDEYFASCSQCFQNTRSIRIAANLIRYEDCQHVFRIP
ncbi:hypothetical protein [Streptomyces sp. NPDC001205]